MLCPHNTKCIRYESVLNIRSSVLSGDNTLRKFDIMFLIVFLIEICRVLCPHNTENIRLSVNIKLVLIVELSVLSRDNALRLDLK